MVVICKQFNNLNTKNLNSFSDKCKFVEFQANIYVIKSLADT
jgi:hypothetical protein